jgi:branched-chain amino acid aminotransferase
MSKAPVHDPLAYVDGAWQKGNPRVLGPQNHAMWLSSTVFDGARAFGGRAPDLDRHCARVIESARILDLAPTITRPEIERLCWEGIRQYPDDASLYICPMFYAEDGFIVPEPESTRFVLILYQSPIPDPDGFSACLTQYRRPARNMAPTEAKASCLYPNVARGVAEARAKGFDTAVTLDANGNVAEFSFANLFMVKDGVVHTPVPTGTFLNGITRQRVTGLLRGDGLEVVERSIDFAELLEADELFCTGNYYKVAPCPSLEDHAMPAGPVYDKARALYFEFARTG